MAINMMALPALRPPEGTDFSPLNRSIVNFAQQRDAKYAEEQRLEGEQYQRGIQKEQLGRQRESHDVDMRKRRVEQISGIAQMIDREADPNKRAVMWQNTLRVDPKLASSLPENARDPMNGPKFLLAEARGFVDPTTEALKKTQLQSAQYELKNITPLQRDMLDAQVKKLKSGDTAGTNDTREYEYARRNGFNGTFLEYMQSRRSSQAPETTEAREIAKARIEEAQKNIRSAQGATDMKGVLNELTTIASDKGLERAIGPIEGNPIYQSTVGQLFSNPTMNARIVRLQSQLELAGGEKMKGLGAQSDSDAARLKSAVSNLSASRNKQEFEEALAVIENSIGGTMARGQQAAKDFPQLAGPLRASESTLTPQQRQRAPVRVNSPDDARRLPSGTPIILPDGTTGLVP